MTIVTRFAPSPTGFLHIGHAHSALAGFRAAQDAGGRFLLRIEDIDRTRCRPEFTTAIEQDLAWLGLRWDDDVRIQSAHMDDYRRALDGLERKGLLYPCFCTRAEIKVEIAASAGAPHGVDGPLYPGTCRGLSADERAARMAKGLPYALRLDIAKALQAVSGPLTFEDELRGTITADPARHGDVVLARKDTPASYHLAVTVDDALQGVTLVTRGEDLLPATDIHRLLQSLLGLPTPRYRHHGLLMDAAGKRFAKRDGGVTLRDLRQAGKNPAAVRALAGFPD